MEFFLKNWPIFAAAAATFTVVLQLFKNVETHISEHLRNEISEWLLFEDTKFNFWIYVTAVLNRVFGVRLFSFRAFAASALITISTTTALYYLDSTPFGGYVDMDTGAFYPTNDAAMESGSRAWRKGTRPETWFLL